MEDKRLLKFWEKSDLCPQTMEEKISIFGKGQIFDNFCPEVVFKKFGYFASYISRFSDETDQDIRHKMLEEEKQIENDRRWLFSSLSPQHYTECDLYSALKQRSKNYKKLWYKKPVGIIILGVMITVIGGLIFFIIGKQFD